MPDPKQLPFLLKLLDDDSTVVRTAVVRELKAFGPTLKDELARLQPPPDAEQIKILQTLLPVMETNHTNV